MQVEYLQHDCDSIFERLASGTNAESHHHHQQQQQQEEAEGGQAVADTPTHQQQQRQAGGSRESLPGFSSMSGGWGFEDIDLTEPYDLTGSEAYSLGSQGLGSQGLESQGLGSQGLGSQGLGSQKQSQGSQPSSSAAAAAAGVLGRSGGLGSQASWGLTESQQPEVFDDWGDDAEGFGAFDLTELEVLALRTTSVTMTGADSAHQAGTEGSAGHQQQQRDGGVEGSLSPPPSAAAAAASEDDQQQQQQQQWEEHMDDEVLQHSNDLDMQQQQQQQSESVGAAGQHPTPTPSGDRGDELMSHLDDVTSPDDKGLDATAAAAGTPPPQEATAAAAAVLRQSKKRLRDDLDLDPAAAAAAADGTEGDREGELLPFNVGSSGGRQQQQQQQRRRVLLDVFGDLQSLTLDNDVSSSKVGGWTPCMQQSMRHSS
jgi:hypothetical protein